MKLEKLTRMPGHLIRRAHQNSTAIFNAEMAEYDLTSIQFIALVAIGDVPGLGASRLAELIALDKATTGGVIERLERKGLLVRRRSEGDARVKVLALTPAGRALVTVCFDRVEEAQSRILDPLTGEERKTFMDLLGKLGSQPDREESQTG